MRGNISKSAPCTTAPPENPEQLGDAINRISSINKRLNNLMIRINGEPIDPDEHNDDIEHVYSLAELMTSGANIIDNNVENAHNLIMDIENVLFTP